MTVDLNSIEERQVFVEMVVRQDEWVCGLMESRWQAHLDTNSEANRADYDKWEKYTWNQWMNQCVKTLKKHVVPMLLSSGRLLKLSLQHISPPLHRVHSPAHLVLR
jgi:hypothetical protein